MARNHPPRIGFMGTPDFALKILQALFEASYSIVGVYTQPPRPVGRGYKVIPSPVQKFAEDHHLPVFCPKTLKTEEAQKEWQALNLDVAIVAAYGLILPKEILEAPKKGAINIHASLLPRWRGAAPIQRAILEGDTETGVTIMKMDVGLDTGDIISMKKMALSPEITTPLLFEKLAALGAEAILEVLPTYLKGKIKPVPQPEEGVTYAKKLEKLEGLLNWNLPASILDQQIRALNPWPGTWFDVGADRIKVLEAEIIAGSFSEPPGTIIDERLTIVCKEGALRPLKVQKIGKAPLSTDEFLRGYQFLSKHLPHDTI
ncbi:MAG: methionyl-tRNA formyltransferase [Alphaproteobacteria bacterium]|nr:methionyl-tRNA formyltransferase [Alphaproteobacteria bacterium]